MLKFFDGQTDRRTDRRTDRVITIGHPPSGGALMKETTEHSPKSDEVREDIKNTTKLIF